MMTPRTRIARTASTGSKARRSLWRETRVPFLTSGEQLGATDESPDAVTKSIDELNATIAKATKIRQDEHLNGPVILPVKDAHSLRSWRRRVSRVVLEQLPSPTSMQLRLGDDKGGVAHASIDIAVQRQEFRFFHVHLLDNGDSHCPSQGEACDEGA